MNPQQRTTTNTLIAMPGVDQTVPTTQVRIKQEPIGGTRTFMMSAERMAAVKCYNCQQFGHMAKQCPQPRKARIGELSAEDQEQSQGSSPYGSQTHDTVVNVDF
jgi:hypothetical protein